MNKRAFFRDLNYRPHPGQIAIHKSNAPRRVVACGVRWGKTLCASMEALAAAMAPAERSIGWICAPTYDLADRVFREVELIAARSLKHHIVSMRESDRRLVLRNMGGGYSEIKAKSADNPISLLGEGLDWLVIDEASRVKPAVWQSHLSQRLIDRKGWALLISTPKGKNWFHEMFRRGQGNDPDYESWNSPSWMNPLLDKAQVDAERARLPDRVFQEQYGAAFIEGSGAVFRHVRECATGEFKEPHADECYWAGLDLAKVADFTVLVIIDAEANVVAVDRFHRVDWSVQVARIHALCERFNNAHILVDSTGAGEPVFEALRHAGCNVEPYPFTMKSKSALIDNLAMMLEHGAIRLPRPDLWPEGLDELESYEFSITESGNIRTSAPSGSHDDCVIGLALAAWQRQESRRMTYTSICDDPEDDRDVRERMFRRFSGGDTSGPAMRRPWRSIQF